MAVPTFKIFMYNTIIHPYASGSCYIRNTQPRIYLPVKHNCVLRFLSSSTYACSKRYIKIMIPVFDAYEFVFLTHIHYLIFVMFLFSPVPESHNNNQWWQQQQQRNIHKPKFTRNGTRTRNYIAVFYFLVSISLSRFFWIID